MASIVTTTKTISLISDGVGLHDWSTTVPRIIGPNEQGREVGHLARGGTPICGATRASTTPLLLRGARRDRSDGSTQEPGARRVGAAVAVGAVAGSGCPATGRVGFGRP